MGVGRHILPAEVVPFSQRQCSRKGLSCDLLATSAHSWRKGASASGGKGPHGLAFWSVSGSDSGYGWKTDLPFTYVSKRREASDPWIVFSSTHLPIWFLDNWWSYLDSGLLSIHRSFCVEWYCSSWTDLAPFFPVDFLLSFSCGCGAFCLPNPPFSYQIYTASTNSWNGKRARCYLYGQLLPQEATSPPSSLWAGPLWCWGAPPWCGSLVPPDAPYHNPPLCGPDAHLILTSPWP